MATGSSDNAFQRYLLALGEFIHAFAGVELHLKVAVHGVARLRPGLGQALFSGLRADTALSFLIRMRQADALPESQILTRISAHFGLINTMRNDIVHLGAVADSNGIMISNYSKALPGSRRDTPVSAEVLHEMIDDLVTISAGLACYHLENEPNTVPIPPAWQVLAQRPWRYKSPPQEKNRHTIRAPRPKRSFPPPA